LVDPRALLNEKRDLSEDEFAARHLPEQRRGCLKTPAMSRHKSARVP
jgi:hypothetical protein